MGAILNLKIKGNETPILPETGPFSLSRIGTKEPEDLVSFEAPRETEPSPTFTDTRDKFGLESIVKIGREIVTAPARAVLTLGLETIGRITGIEDIQPSEFGKAGETILGERPVERLKPTGERFLKDVGVEDAPGFATLPLGIGLTALDILTGGGKS